MKSRMQWIAVFAGLALAGSAQSANFSYSSSLLNIQSVGSVELIEGSLPTTLLGPADFLIEFFDSASTLWEFRSASGTAEPSSALLPGAELAGFAVWDMPHRVGETGGTRGRDDTEPRDGMAGPAAALRRQPTARRRKT